MISTAKRLYRPAALAVVAIIACLAIILSLPAVQTGLALSLAERMEGVVLELDSLSAGPGGVELENLRVEIASLSAELEVARADVDLAFWSSLLGLRFDVEVATLRGVDLNLELPQESQEPSDSEDFSFDGLRSRASIPAWLAIRELDADGEVLVSDGGDLEFGGTWELDVASLTSAATAIADFTSTVESRRLGETLASAEISADTTALIDADSRIQNFSVTAEISPTGDRPGLRTTATAELDEAAETYAIDIEDTAGNELAKVDAVFETGGNLEADWEVDLNPGVVAAFATGRSVADLSGQSTGSIQVNLITGTTEVQSSTELNGEGWDAFDPRLSELGRLTLTMELNGGVAEALATADTIDLQLSSSIHGELFRVNTLQPLSYEPGNWRINPQTWGEPALRIEAFSMPLRWLGSLNPVTGIEGGEFSGSIEINRQDEQLTELLVTQPLQISGVRLAPVRGFDIPDINVRLVPHATLSDSELTAEIEELTIEVATGLEVTLTGIANTSPSDWPNASFDGSISARVPALQRIMPQLDDVRGAARFDFNFDTLDLLIGAADVDAHSLDGRELLAADLSGQQPLLVELPTFAPNWDDFNAQAVSLRLSQVPIDWLSPYIPELELRGGELSGALSASVGLGQGLTLESNEPLTIDNLLPIYRGQPAIATWSASVSPRVILSTGATSVSIGDLRIETDRGNEIVSEISLYAEAGSNEIEVAVSLDADVAEAAERFGLQLGGLHWRHAGTLNPSEQRFALNDLSVSLEDLTGTEILLLENLRPFTITTDPFGVAVEDGSTEIIHAVVTPLQLGTLLPNILELDLEGVLREGEFFGRAEPGGGLVLAAEEPLVFHDVSVHWDDVALLERVTTSILYEVAYSTDGLEARSVDLTATDQNGQTLVHTTSRVIAPLSDVQFVNQAGLTLEANLADLAEQPVLADLPRFSDGVLQASLEIDDNEISSLLFDASLRDAVTETLGELPDVDLDLSVSGVRGERAELTMPIRLESDDWGVSDIRVDGALDRDADGVFDLDASIAGDQLAVADIQELVALFVPAADSALTADSIEIAPLSDEAMSAIAKLRAERHSVPLWTDRLVALTTVEIDRLIFPSFTVEDIQGQLGLTQEQARITDIHASLLGAELTANAAVDFDNELPAPYSLDFRADVAQIEPEKLFLEIAPNAAPVVEGDFELSSTLTGAGLNPLDLALSTFGELRLSGTDGIFRGLAAHASTGSTAARVIGVLTFSRELRAVGRMLDDLGELRFREAEFLLERDEPDRIEVSQLLVESPQLLIDASGSLALAPGRPLLLSPLDVSATLAASGDVEILFNGMGLLEEEDNEAGYRELTRAVRLGGTPTEPDTSEFWELLEEAADNSGGALGVGLRELNRRLEAQAQ